MTAAPPEDDSPAIGARGRTRAAVLGAAAELLAEGGLPASTIDAIRDRSGVSKTTIYKHWPNRLCVAVDAFTDHLASGASLPDTGSARSDFREQVRRVSTFYASPAGKVYAQLLTAALQDADAAVLLRTRLLASRRLGVRVLWERALARGEVRDDLDPDLALDLLFGPAMWRLLSGRDAFTEADTDAYVDAVLTGIGAVGQPGAP